MQNVKSQSGFSIIEVLVSIGVMSIFMLIMSEMMRNQNKEIKAFSEKILFQDVSLQLKTALSSPSYCECLLRGNSVNTTATPMVLNQIINGVPSGYNQPIPAAPAACVASAAGGFIIPPNHSALSGSQIVVASTQIEDLVDLGGGTSYAARLKIFFDNTSLVRALKPVDVPISFSVNAASPNNAKAITSCGAGGGGAGPGSNTYVLSNPGASTGWLTNSTGRPQTVYVSTIGGWNLCQVSGQIQGLGEVAATRNEDHWAKRCFINFMIPPGATWIATGNLPLSIALYTH